MTTAASSNVAELAQLTDQLKSLATHLYDLEVTAADYPADAETLINDKLKVLVNDFARLEESSATCTLSVPQDVLEYIEAGRNPNVYTRQFSEAVTRESQNMHGKMTAHRDFAELLAAKVKSEYPELAQEVDNARRTSV